MWAQSALPGTMSSPDLRVDLLVRGQIGTACLLQASTNLLDWSLLATMTNTSGAVEFIDDPATNAQRFYRAKPAP